MVDNNCDGTVTLDELSTVLLIEHMGVGKHRAVIRKQTADRLYVPTPNACDPKHWHRDDVTRIICSSHTSGGYARYLSVSRDGTLIEWNAGTSTLSFTAHTPAGFEAKRARRISLTVCSLGGPTWSLW